MKEKEHGDAQGAAEAEVEAHFRRARVGRSSSARSEKKEPDAAEKCA